MPSIRPRNPERASDRRLLRAIGRSPVPERRNRSNQLDTRVFARSDIYTRPDVYDMEYEGSSNEDAHFFARLLARIRARRVLELACGSGRVIFTLARGPAGGRDRRCGLIDRHDRKGGSGARCH